MKQGVVGSNPTMDTSLSKAFLNLHFSFNWFQIGNRFQNVTKVASEINNGKFRKLSLNSDNTCRRKTYQGQ